jgi:hypothetical protein
MALLEEKTQYDNMVKTLGADHPDTIAAKQKLRAKQMGIASAVTTGTTMATEFIDPNREDGTVNTKQAMAKSALTMGAQGAAAGMAFGPVGALVGGGLGAIGGALFGKKSANAQNRRVRNANLKAFSKKISFAADKEESLFNSNAPQYLSKGGEVKKGKDEILDSEGRKRDTLLRKAQEKLTLALQKKYPNIPMADFIKRYGSEDYDSRKIEDYAVAFEGQYGKTYLTPEEMKAVLGAEEYSKYQNNLKLHLKSQWGSVKNVNGELEQKIAAESTSFGPRHMLGRYAWNDLRNGGGPYGAMNNPEFNPSGWVYGKKGKDVNTAKVTDQSFVIPATDNPKLNDTVEKIARVAGIDKSLQKNNNKGNTEVKLTKDELVVSPEKVQELQQKGIDLTAVKDSINADKEKGKTMKPTRKYLGKFAKGGLVKTQKEIDDELLRIKLGLPSANLKGVSDPRMSGINIRKNDSKKRLLKSDVNTIGDSEFVKKSIDVTKAPITVGEKKKPTKSSDKSTSESTTTTDPFASDSNYKTDRIIATMQSVAGIAGQIKNEQAVRRNFRQQQNVADKAKAEEEGAIFASAAEKRAAIETGFKDTRNTIERLKKGSMKDLAKNSLTTAEFGANYAQTAAALGDKVGDANLAKTSAILNVQGDATSQIRDTIRSAKQDDLNRLSTENGLNSAKLTQSALLQKAGIDNLLSSIKQERNETIRKRKMNQLLKFAKDNNLSLRQLGYINDEDVANLGGK